MKLETPVITIQKTQEAVFTFLTDLKNFEQLMPSNTEKFVVEKSSFLFGLSGMPEVRLVLEEQVPSNKIVLGAASSKLDFSLTIVLESMEVTTTKGQLFFDGKFNPMMAMMVKKPLTNFINALSENLKNI